MMKTYLITGNSFSSAFVGDEEFNGCEVVISTYRVENETAAKKKAIAEYEGLEITDLIARELK